MGPCKLCGADAPKGHEYCHACTWKAKWPEHILKSPDMENRRKRSHLVKLLSVDHETPEAFFQSSSTDATYTTTLQTCTCVDFERGHGAHPCKHIFRLAEELGLFQSEYFADGEDDYTMHPSMPREENNAAPKSGPLGGKRFVFTGELSSMKRKEAQAKVEALGGETSSDVSSRTSYLVAGDKGGAKLKKAGQLGIPIICEDEFLGMLRDGTSSLDEKEGGGKDVQE